MMETLLIVLVIGCALAFVVQVGRGIWARARTVERHQQALDTLAGPDTTPRGATKIASAGPHEHQAHVRLIGPGEPRAVAATRPRYLRLAHSPSSGSSFRRPSRPIAAGAALEPAAFEASWAEAVPIEAAARGARPRSFRTD